MKTQNGPEIVKIFYSNCQSVMNTIHELKTIVNIKKPDIICVTESWTNSNVADAELKIPGYELMARRDRVDTKHGIGGGILIWTRVGF